MPTSYTTTVTVDGYASANYGSQLDSLEIITGSTSPYELPQPPSARASFLGLPVVSGVTQTPDWWIGKKLTFTITPQAATGSVSWAGIVQGYSVSPVQTTSTDQIVELDLLGQTSRLSTETIIGTIGNVVSMPLVVNLWSEFDNKLNTQLAKTTWDEVPAGMTWDDAEGTWDTFTNNKSGLSFVWDVEPSIIETYDQIDVSGQDMLSALTNIFSNKYHGWFWFDDTTITLSAPTSYTGYSQITSLDATSSVLWSSLQTNQNFNNIVNNGTLDNWDGSETTAYMDGTSYNAFGNRYQNFGTSYEWAAGRRLSVLEDKINGYKAANTYLQSFTIDLDELTHVTGEWQNFYKSTKPVRLPVTNIPAAYGGNHTYMVRGVQLNLTRKHAEATLIVVPSTIYNPS